jgi:hypothetical protein
MVVEIFVENVPCGVVWDLNAVEALRRRVAEIVGVEKSGVHVYETSTKYAVLGESGEPAARCIQVKVSGVEREIDAVAVVLHQFLSHHGLDAGAVFRFEIRPDRTEDYITSGSTADQFVREFELGAGDARLLRVLVRRYKDGTLGMTAGENALRLARNTPGVYEVFLCFKDWYESVGS